ncbi:LacI family transcriptional regulator (plasmid) [Arthrobacter sp. StoSoilB3]|nr:LacI family transcriptional regulator [Arthrobacter sp. StoSoilB3]
MSRSTMADVAREAGVSLTTVSHALNGKGRVDKNTRERIRAVAQELGFTPSRTARNLALGRSDTIGLVLSGQRSMPLAEHLATDWYGRIVVGSSRAANARQRALSVLPQIGSASEIAAYGLDGAIVLDPEPDDIRCAILDQAQIPYVLLGNDPTRPTARRIVPDMNRAMEELLDHFVEMGARLPAVIAPGPDFSGSLPSVEAYRSWCHTHGRAPVIVYSDISRSVTRDDMTAACQDAMIKLLSHQPGIDAVVGLFEGFGRGIILAADKLGRQVPGDLLVAQDIDGADTQYAATKITAIDLHPEELAAQAIAMLVDDPSHDDPHQRAVAATLKIRESTTRSSHKS